MYYCVASGLESDAIIHSAILIPSILQLLDFLCCCNRPTYSPREAPKKKLIMQLPNVFVLCNMWNAHTDSNKFLMIICLKESNS